MTTIAGGRAPDIREGRNLGVDLVRGLAILAMIIAHVRMWWPVESRPVVLVLSQINNVASPLFCLVMGVAAGIVLVRPTRRVRPGPFVARNVVRGLALIAIGLLIEGLPSYIAIVLQVLGLVLIVGSPLVLLPVPVIVLLAGATFVLGPFVNEVVQEAYGPPRPEPGPLDRLLGWFALPGSYRVTNLLPFFLVGAVLGRRGLPRRAVIAVAVLGLLGLVVLAGAFVTGRDLSAGGLLDNVSDLGLSFTAFGVTILAARTNAARRTVELLSPLTAVGALALTTYVLHVLLIAALNHLVGWPTLQAGWLPFSVLVLVSVVGGAWWWWRCLGRGPIERLIALATDRIR